MSQLFHKVVNFLISFTKLDQNHPVGWESFNRKNGHFEREQQPLFKKLKLLLLFNPLTEWIDTTHLMRLYIHNKSLRAGIEEGEASSRKQIPGFVEAYDIKMADFDPSDITEYSSFEAFFARQLRKGARPITRENDSGHAVVVADSRVVVFDSVEQAQTLWVKGQDFNMTNLAMDMDLGKVFDGGCVASFRLSPQDYHRYHSPVKGVVKVHRSIPGDYYQVDPEALRSKVDILTRNRRDLVLIDTETFGRVLFVAIGATDVGSVQIHHEFQQPGAEVEKGQEIGLFQFGGSSIIVAFEPGRIKFDADLRTLTNDLVQTSVEVGMSLGEAAHRPKKQGQD